ncbi:Assimilatory nitrate reductase large subunit [Fulvivirga imtechensis AK7]|uniref:nitrate reductase (cytochrome) n=1 Tax=Fulvivirga imtechensis AK7 TaxID=1237149 RepID=L8JME1_9BACT|nr:nitrate reductase [Fulvivirga imtechensis]ELR69980.1 Assimilatory nitrate reductase large subunit [Fulvivirga imtechensis AK7]
MPDAHEKFKTTCSYCGVGCGIEVTVTGKDRLALNGDPDHPVNKGMLCSKGMNLHYTVMDRTDRLLFPQMRWSKAHPMERVNWDAAIQRAAAVFKTLIEQHGPDSVGFYISGQCLTEEYYLVNKLVKGFLGTNNIDTNSRLCMSSAVAGYKQALGEDSVPIAYEDIEQADCFFIAGANPAWCHPILFRRLEAHKAKNPDTKIIVVDPRVTDTCHLADVHLQILPGTDTVLFHAIGRWLIENGYTDEQFILNHTDGYDHYRKAVLKITLKQAASICKVSVNDLELAARYIGSSKGFISMWAMGLNQSTAGVNKNLALLNLHLITGQIGKPGSGPFSLTGQPNAMGGREVGGMANLLAAHKDLANPEHRESVAKFWGVKEIDAKPGLTATQMFEALRDGRMKAVWIICTNPSVSMPNARLVDEALSAAKFVVVQDISQRSDTLKYADLVLPAASWLEKEGTMTNSERRISYLSKVIDPPGEALPDSEIILRFARAMGFHGFDFDSLGEVYAEHCRLTKGTNIDISGLDYSRLKQLGTVQWPVPSLGHQGTTRLFTDKKFYTPNQRAQIKTNGEELPTEQVTPDHPLILTTGRIRDQWHTMTRTGKVNRLNKHLPHPFLEIHPSDATSRGIKEGDPVVVSSQRGEVRVNAVITSNIKQGVVFLPMHWGKHLGQDFGRANNVTDDSIDPTSKQPGFKFSAVEVKKYLNPKQKIIIVGAGAAAYRFINTYRQFNSEDEIHVFSREPWPFYNRVLLPEYVNETKDWEDLLKCEYDELRKLNIHLHLSNAITSINRENKTVTDQQRVLHDYDILILATGSRAFVPPDAPMYLPGVFTMRDRQNADDLKNYLKKDGHVLVIGGGLLGLEIAAALREMKIEITLVQLGSRLMERQLDTTASSLLRQYVEDIGINVFTNDQVNHIELLKNGDGLYINLQSGKSLNCDAVVYAIGTKPNIELGKEAGLDCGRGVVVNHYLQTSDSSIYALGEIAEHDQKLNGITAAAEQQADICARYLVGDLTASYQGSVSMNILKFSHLDLCSVGLPEIPANSKGYDEIIFLDRSQLYYKKCIVKGDKLMGTILMGDKLEFAEFKELIENGTELSEKRMQLLRSNKKVVPVSGKLVCSCNNVGQGNLEEAIHSGCHSLNALCEKTGAGLGCGSCKPEVQRILLKSEIGNLKAENHNS